MSATRRINVLECREVHRGQGAKGEYVIYEVTATSEAGDPIELELRSFSQLPTGVGEYEVSEYRGKKGVSYTLKKPGGSGGGGGARLGPKVDELRDRVDALEETVKRLRDEVAGLKSNAHHDARQTQQQPATSDASRFGGDDDIPF